NRLVWGCGFLESRPTKSKPPSRALLHFFVRRVLALVAAIFAQLDAVRRVATVLRADIARNPGDLAPAARRALQNDLNAVLLLGHRPVSPSVSQRAAHGCNARHGGAQTGRVSPAGGTCQLQSAPAH